MKKFNFSLEALLKTKQLLKREQEITLARLTHQKERLLSERRGLEAEIVRTNDVYRQRMEKGLFPSELATYASYLKRIRVAFRDKSQEILDKEAEENLAREALRKLQQESKMLDILKDKKFLEYQKELQTQVLVQMDERIAYDESDKVQGV